ncbi:interleukin-27 subunit beta [Pseudophryne corroboree]|uniref:interleukin-27 subunit beta n=1 Tax=Pseudophryne corroboree TaxID=495146 RepID=UPI003081E0BA
MTWRAVIGEPQLSCTRPAAELCKAYFLAHNRNLKIKPNSHTVQHYICNRKQIAFFNWYKFHYTQHCHLKKYVEKISCCFYKLENDLDHNPCDCTKSSSSFRALKDSRCSTLQNDRTHDQKISTMFQFDLNTSLTYNSDKNTSDSELCLFYAFSSISCYSSYTVMCFPNTHQTEQLGTDVFLHCDTHLPFAEWRFNGEWIQYDQNICSNERQLTLRGVKKHQSGNYTCHNPENDETLSLTELQLGLPPEKLHVQCSATSYPENINCTWDLLPDTNLPTTFITTYRLGLMSREPPQDCVQVNINPNSCLISDFQMFAEFPYVLNVTAFNQLGSITHLHPFIVENIIHPDPPVKVTLSPIQHESKKLLLQWRPPPSWPHPKFFPLTYLIRYKMSCVRSYRMVGPYEQTSFTLTGIRPGCIVQAQVAAKDFTGSGHYSDWSELAIGQPWRKS